MKPLGASLFLLLLLRVHAQAPDQSPAPCLELPAAQRPYNHDRLRQVIAAQGPNRAAFLIRSCGVSAVYNASLEAELRNAAVPPNVLQAVREVAPRPDPPKPKEDALTKTNPKDGLTYVFIPPGRFTMGCPPADPECSAAEKPEHEVRITNGFWLSRTETTQAAYQRVTGRNPSFSKGNHQLPVEQVVWEEADAYCRAIGGRLPSEAEWEYAARGASNDARYWDLKKVAWFTDNSGDQSHNVGEKQPNGFGLVDMLGNVWEYIADFYSKDYYANSPTENPKGPAQGTDHVIRGGSWDALPSMVHVAVRRPASPGIRRNFTGFRCIWEPK